MLSTSYKFSKKDTSYNCADIKQICVLLPFPFDIFCVSLLLRNTNYVPLILTHSNINIYSKADAKLAKLYS